MWLQPSLEAVVLGQEGVASHISRHVVSTLLGSFCAWLSVRAVLGQALSAVQEHHGEQNAGSVLVHSKVYASYSSAIW